MRFIESILYLYLLGSADFLGYQMYTSTIVEAKVNPLVPSYYDADRDFVETQDPSWHGYGIAFIILFEFAMFRFTSTNILWEIRMSYKMFRLTCPKIL